MKNFCLFFTFLVWGFHVSAAEKVVMGYFTSQPASVFETKIKPMFARFTEKCSACEIRNLTPYNDKGEFVAAKVADAVKAATDVTFFLIDWNERVSDQNKALSDLLDQEITQGKLVVAAAGVPLNSEGSCPLAKTMMGQVDDAVIIGELVERDRLLPLCYYGPEMLTSVRPPKDLIGQGYGALYFSAHLAAKWDHRKPAEWLSYFKSKKTKSKRIWPELEEFFPR